MFDIAILGGGPGGYVAAIRASQLGGNVCLIEKNEVGGTCLNRGCIPTKSMLASAEIIKNIKRASDFGVNIEGYNIDIKKIVERKNTVVKQLVNGVGMLLNHHKIKVIKGNGILTSKNKITVTKNDGVEIIEAKNIIIATGSEAKTFPNLGYNGKNIVTSTELLDCETIPKHLVIIGAGVIGCEFASVFSELGTKITMIEALDSILPMMDRDIIKRFTITMKKKKIAIKLSAAVESVIEKDSSIEVKIKDGDTIDCDKVLIGVGRTFNTEGIGLEKVGVELGIHGEIKVDDYLKTNIDGIYAIGDVNGKVLLAHAASAQGTTVVENILKGSRKVPDVSVIPNCIYTDPEIASVGLTSVEASARYETKTGQFPFVANGKALCIGEKDGFVKIITEKSTDKVLGAHIIGPHATDLIGELTLAIKNDLTAEDIVKTVHAHPTLSEAIMEAAEGVHDLMIHSV